MNGRSEEEWYTLETDESGHHYVIPCDKLNEWNDKWIFEEDPPDWAYSIGGAPSLIRFTYWEVVNDR